MKKYVLLVIGFLSIAVLFGCNSQTTHENSTPNIEPDLEIAIRQTAVLMAQDYTNIGANDLFRNVSVPGYFGTFNDDVVVVMLSFYYAVFPAGVPGLTDFGLGDGLTWADSRMFAPFVFHDGQLIIFSSASLQGILSDEQILQIVEIINNKNS